MMESAQDNTDYSLSCFSRESEVVGRHRGVDPGVGVLIDPLKISRMDQGIL